ncbi:phosphoribosylglycinamide synthetase, ATP-grasp domain protein [[Clostridium] bifermentans ATCC 19299]|uniref:ATP-grasp domain-containing protein n=1 Tax=Paraclostridium bifermentans TaxID=1490 RepID=UPI00038CC6F5|nr:ATP-grasp domain-containing protein [Paraclostridium bifermentans]EQK41156.1 phosphoribosylglycinamide synthetase, ATP-grasp domain protein [[Clostridium] bifermentans ATCC 19299] [Paraclostridium bifermentans ATCC 19299]
MKHILVIDGFIPVHLKLQELGARLTIICETGRIKGKYPNLYYRVIQVPWESTHEERISLAKAIHIIDPFDSIVNAHENNQYLTSKIAIELGLRYHSLECIEKIYNKEKMRLALNKAGLDTTIGMKVTNKKDLDLFASKHGYPVVIKPSDGWASKGVSIVKNKLELEEAISWFNDSEYEQLYVEEYICGKEYSIECFTENKINKVVAITEKFKTNKHCIEIGQCDIANLDEHTIKNIEVFMDKFISIMGIAYGPSHTEVIIQDDNCIKVIETHCRLGGDNIHLLVNNALGIDMIDLWARQILGECIIKKIHPIKNKYSAIWYIISDQVGKVDFIPDFKKFESNNLEININKNVGDMVKELKDSYSRLGYVIVTGDKYEETINKAREMASLLKEQIDIVKVY